MLCELCMTAESDAIVPTLFGRRGTCGERRQRYLSRPRTCQKPKVAECKKRPQYLDGQECLPFKNGGVK